MRPNTARHLRLVPEPPLVLPEGVTAAHWALERTHWQNPRLRSLLGCLKLLDGVSESNYTILYCSSLRVYEILREVQKVARLLRTEFTRYLESPSPIPELEQERQQAIQATKVFEVTVLDPIEQIDDSVPEDRLPEVRKLLCDSLGRIHSFLRECLGRFLAADPRSRHNADYFLSKRFPEDIEDSEWLSSSVESLNAYLQGLDPRQLSALAQTVRNEELLDDGPTWDQLAQYVEELSETLIPRLKGLLIQRGIRVDELELLDNHTAEIPRICALVSEIRSAGQELTRRILESTPATPPEQQQSARNLKSCQEVYGLQVGDLTANLASTVEDLRVFVGFWLENIRRRRALVLKKIPRARAVAGSEPSSLPQPEQG